MILNDALKQHAGCLYECEEKLERCKDGPPHRRDCEEKGKACRIDCDFDHSPN